ncbi:Enamine/imine deaminase [compost metagenome]
MTDLQGFAQVNEVMASMLSRPYPARATVEVSALPRSAQIEIEAVVALPANKG